MFKKIILALMLSSSLAFAQSEKGGVFSLDDCIKIAEEKNYDIKLAEIKYGATDMDIKAANGAYLPTLAYTFDYTHNFTSTNVNNSYNMNLGANYSLFDGFSRNANSARAEENKKALALTKDYTRLNIKFNVIKNYIAVVKASAIIKIKKENYLAGKQDLEKAQALYDAGSSTVYNVYTQEAELANRELAVVQAENDFNLAKADLLTTLGLSPDMQADFNEASVPAEFSKSEIEKFRNEIGDFKTAVAMGLKNRFDYQASDLNVSTAKSSLKSSQAGYYPSVGLSAAWGYSNNDFNAFSSSSSTTAGLSLSFPIFSQYQTDLAVENATVNVKEREIEQAQLEQTVKASVQSSFLNLSAAEKQMEITEKGLYSAKQSYESAGERYRMGSTSIVDYQTANTTYVTAQINKISAAFNYFQAQKQALFAIGLLK